MIYNDVERLYGLSSSSIRPSVVSFKCIMFIYISDNFCYFGILLSNMCGLFSNLFCLFVYLAFDWLQYGLCTAVSTWPASVVFCEIGNCAAQCFIDFVAEKIIVWFRNKVILFESFVVNTFAIILCSTLLVRTYNASFFYFMCGRS